MSRKITTQAVRAFYENKNFKLANTEVHADSTGTYLYLWGNLIAKKCGQRVSISLAGYNTVTTRERLNGLLKLVNKGVTTKQGRVYLVSKEGKEEIKTNEFITIGSLEV